MHSVKSAIIVPRLVSDVFAFFLRPANRLSLASPELQMELLAGPEVIELGTRMTWRVRRLGISQRIVSEITALQPDQLLVEEQREGPLRKFIRTLRFEEVPEGTRLTEAIDFEPPGGLLGLVVSAGMVQRDLETALVYRDRKLRELFGS